MRFASGLWLKSVAFANHVLSVVSERAEEEMIWSNAAAIITMMENTEPRWNLSVVQFPTVPMRTNGMAAPMIQRRTDVESSIASVHSRTGPFPTLLRPPYFEPETFLSGLVKSHAYTPARPLILS
jgi:hypothetical protein